MSLPTGEMPLRWDRIRGAMARRNIEGLLVFSNQLIPEPIHFVANYSLVGGNAFCYLPLEGEPILFISEAWDLKRVQRESSISEVRYMGENWAREIAEEIKKNGGQLGLAGREDISRTDLQALEGELKQETVSAMSVLEEVATIKSPYELTLIREASKMADAGFAKALEVSGEGLSDYELAAEIEYAMRKMGATDNFQMMVVGKDNTGMLLPTGKKIEPDDLLLFEITPANGSITYSAQLCRTAVCGRPSKIMEEKYDLLIEALEESLKAIKPGVKINEVLKIQNKIIGDAGYADYCKPPYMRVRGHNFGLGHIAVREDNENLFVEGMSMVIHPNQFIPETGYLALGEQIIVTSEGIERLTASKSKLYECGGES